MFRRLIRHCPSVLTKIERVLRRFGSTDCNHIIPDRTDSYIWCCLWCPGPWQQKLDWTTSTAGQVVDKTPAFISTVVSVLLYTQEPLY